MELFEYIVKLLVCMLECYLIYDFFRDISDVKDKFTKKSVVMIYATTVLILYVINLANNAILNLVVFIALLFGFTVVLFDISMKIRIFYFAIAFSLNMVSEFLYVILIEIKIEPYKTVPLLTDNILQVIAVCFLKYIIFTMVKCILSKKDRIMPTNIFFMYMCLPVASFWMIMTVFYSGVNFEENPQQKITIIVSVLFMLFANILIFYAFNKHAEQIYEGYRQEIAAIKKDYEQMHVQEILKNDEKHHELMHNASNYLKVLERLIQSGEKEKAQDIIVQLNEEFKRESERT